MIRWRRTLSVVLLSVVVVACRSAKNEATSTAPPPPPPSPSATAAAATKLDDLKPEQREPKTVAPGASATTGAGGGGEAEKPKEIGAGISVSGRLPPDVIQGVVRKNLPKIRGCYDTGLQKNPKLEGKVSVRFVIGSEGAVSSATRDGDTTLGDATVVDCVVGQFKKLTFPKPEGGIVTVVYPVVFSRTE